MTLFLLVAGKVTATEAHLAAACALAAVTADLGQMGSGHITQALGELVAILAMAGKAPDNLIAKKREPEALEAGG